MPALQAIAADRGRNLLNDLVKDYPPIVSMVGQALVGEALPALQPAATDDHVGLQRIATQILKDIGRTTTHRLSHQAERLLCRHCLARCSAHNVRLPWFRSVTYYGCRCCGQSREFFKGQVVAMLDRGVTSELSQSEEILRVNWLTRRTLFDFDRVEISRATDEDVERFAVQVGNDTDPYRKPRYKRMRCIVRCASDLSENTLRILERMFGQVEH